MHFFCNKIKMFEHVDVIDAYGSDAYVSDAYVSDAYVIDAYVSDAYVSDAYVSDAYVSDVCVKSTLLVATNVHLFLNTITNTVNYNGLIRILCKPQLGAYNY